MRSLSPSKEHWDQYHRYWKLFVASRPYFSWMHPHRLLHIFRCSGEPKIVHNNGAIGEHDPDHVDDMMHEEAPS